MYGSHHSLEKQFQSMNIFLQRYDYTVTLIKREKDISSLRSPYSLKVESYSFNNALCQVWLKLAQWFWRGRFLNFVTIFSYFVIISPWKMVWPFIWTNFIFTQGCFVLRLVEIGSVVSEKKMWKVSDWWRTGDQKSSLNPSAQVN